jgi:hypothetical protein
MIVAFMFGVLAPVGMAAAGGFVYGWNSEKEVGDSFRVWFRPKIGTAFFYAGLSAIGFGLLPGLILGAAFAATRYWKHRFNLDRTHKQ